MKMGVFSLQLTDRNFEKYTPVDLLLDADVYLHILPDEVGQNIFGYLIAQKQFLLYNKVNAFSTAVPLL